MKKLILATLVLVFGSTALAQIAVVPPQNCKEVFTAEAFEQRAHARGNLGVFLFGGAYTFFLPIFGLAVSSVGLTKASIHWIKASNTKKMLKLIEEAESFTSAYAATPDPTARDKIVPGKTLHRLYQSLTSEEKPEFSLLRLAQSIEQGSDDKTLCTDPRETLHKLKRNYVLNEETPAIEPVAQPPVNTTPVAEKGSSITDCLTSEEKIKFENGYQHNFLAIKVESIYPGTESANVRMQKRLQLMVDLASRTVKNNGKEEIKISDPYDVDLGALAIKKEHYPKFKILTIELRDLLKFSRKEKQHSQSESQVNIGIQTRNEYYDVATLRYPAICRKIQDYMKGKDSSGTFSTAGTLKDPFGKDTQLSLKTFISTNAYGI